MSVLKDPRILSFIIGEVIRQRHDVTTPEGALRILWMVDAWDYAVSKPLNSFPTVLDMVILGRLVEPRKNSEGGLGRFRAVGVFVNGQRTPAAAHVPRLLENLWEARDRYSSDEFYVEFERIHPFLDGNGRVGKILHNWISGHLHDPVLVKDYFGHGVP